MGRAKLTEESYNKLVAALLETPDAHEHPYRVGKQCGVDERTVRKAWLIGWPLRGWRPIEQLAQEARQKARANLQAQQMAERAARAKEREDAILQASAAYAQEGQIVTAARAASTQAVIASLQLAAGARELSNLAKAKIIKEAQRQDSDPEQLSAAGAVGMLQRIADVQSRINDLARTAMDMERMHFGEPSQPLAAPTQTREMTMEELEARIETLQATLGRAKDSGGLTLIKGGLAEPVIGKRVTGA